MEEHEDEDDMLNCPDCQLQTLQHQQTYSSEIIPSTEFHNEANNQESSGNSYKASKSAVDHTLCSGKHNQSNFDLSLRDFTSTSCLFKSATSEYSSTTSTSTSNAGTTSQPVMTVPSGPLSDILPSTATCVTPVPLEHCEVAGYCPTCAVLDLPSNDKFYRPNMARPVYPPLFYGQGPPPPMPGFSPLPECSPWNASNSTDYSNYSYPQYQQQQQPSTSTTTATVSSSSEYYATSTVMPSFPSPVGISQSSSFSSCLYDNKSTEPKQIFSQWNQKKMQENNDFVGSNITTKFLESSNPAQSGEKSMIPITISSSSEDSSDTDSFISQPNVTVEDDEDEHGSLRLCEIDRQNKCIVCQNPIALTECASPQLVNILEHLHEDITAEDLDMSVSSGDIEIGGIEDEVRGFGAKRPSHSYQLSLGRLASLMDVPVKAILTLHNKETEKSASLQDADSVAANLCNRCFKLATKADSLDKQLRSCCSLLKQVSQPHLPPDESLKTACRPTHQNCYVASSQDPAVDNRICKSTQTENSECIMPVHESCTTYSGIATITGKPLQTETVFINPTLAGSMQLCSEASSFLLNPEEFNTETITLENVSTLDFGTGTSTIIVLTDTIVSHPPPKEGDQSTVTVLDEIGSRLHVNPHQLREDSSELEDEMCSGGGSIDQDQFSITDDRTPCELICEKCGVSATSYRAFQTHMLKHTEDYSIRCEHCGKGLTSKASLIIHLRSHTKERPFSCDYNCGKSFTTNSNLTAHKRSCLNNAENTKKRQASEAGLKQLERRFKERTNNKSSATMHTCEELGCGKSFHKRSEYQKHLLTHSGIRPYECKTCSAAFATKGNLGAHMSTHSSDKRFQCSVCDKGFNRKHALQIHENRHQGIRSYSCEVCKKGFFDPGNLQNHRKIHKSEG